MISFGQYISGFVGLTLILVFSVALDWLPASGYVPFFEDPAESLRRMILPTLTLGVYLSATLLRFLRADMIDWLDVADKVEDLTPGGLVDRILEHLYGDEPPTGVPRSVLVPHEPDDAATYVEADVMKAAIKDLHFQQASVQMAIAQLQAANTRSPWATPWPWFTLIVLGLLIAQAVG
jgi:hypothetical protein